MRLIDADVLAKRIMWAQEHNENVTVLALISDAPAVTPTLQLEDITDEDVAKFAIIWQRATSKGLILEPERPQASNNAELFKQTFGIYATELWSMKEADFLNWLNAEVRGEDHV